VYDPVPPDTEMSTAPPAPGEVSPVAVPVTVMVEHTINVAVPVQLFSSVAVTV